MRIAGFGAAVLLVGAAGAASAGGMTDEDAMLGPDGMPGDAEYGAYLAQECAACHSTRSTGTVPPIAGIAPAYFREAMAEYASGERDSPPMAMVVRSLDDEQMAALAVHLSRIGDAE